MDPLSILLWPTALAALAGALFCLGIRRQIRRAVGATRHQNCPLARSRGGYTLLVVAASCAFLALDSVHYLPAALTLVAGLATTWLRPGFEDHVFGTDGVRRGWFARRFEDLDEWRLTGEHLRWRLYGVWLATEVPTEHHAELRARLEAIAPDRQSRFAR